MDFNIPDISLFRHRADIQLRFNDVDVLGHVNNTVYFSFYDTGKALYLTDVRKKQADWKRVDTVIANVDCAFLAPILYGQRIEVLTRCLAVGNKSFKLQQMLRDKISGEVKSLSHTVMVAYDPDSKTSNPLPEALRMQLLAYDDLSLD